MAFPRGRAGQIKQVRPGDPLGVCFKRTHEAKMEILVDANFGQEPNSEEIHMTKAEHNCGGLAPNARPAGNTHSCGCTAPRRVPAMVRVFLAVLAITPARA